MTIVRGMVLGMWVTVLAVAACPGMVAAQFTCEDFLTQGAAQHYLEQHPDNPYGLDPDGNGIACEDMTSSSDGAAQPTTESQAATTQAEAGPLDARLGGTIESWQAAFGPPVK